MQLFFFEDKPFKMLVYLVKCSMNPFSLILMFDVFGEVVIGGDTCSLKN